MSAHFTFVPKSLHFDLCDDGTLRCKAVYTQAVMVTMQLQRISDVPRKEGLSAHGGAASVLRIVVFPAALLRRVSTVAADARLLQKNSSYRMIMIDAILEVDRVGCHRRMNSE